MRYSTEIRTGPASAGSAEDSVAGKGAALAGPGHGEGVWSGTPPLSMWKRLTRGKVMTSPEAAAMRALGVVVCSATRPQRTEPSARPPWKVMRYVPRARAWTHAGTETWTEVLSEAMVLVQQKPEKTSGTMMIAGRWTKASMSRVPAL